MTNIPMPSTAEQTSTILIVAADELQSVESDPGSETDIRIFADNDAIMALQCISRDRPEVVVLGRAFVESPRGAALVNAIKTDHTLTNTQIRVISEASDYFSLILHADPQAESDEAMPAEPLPADYLGTRSARRFTLQPNVVVRVDGNPTTLIELSRTGAGLVGPTLLRLQRRVRLVMAPLPMLFGVPALSSGCRSNREASVRRAIRLLCSSSTRISRPSMP